MKQLFWVAWVSYHHLPKVCDSLQSRMLAGLLIADMLEPLWPAAALPLTLKGSFLQLPFILLFSGFPGHYLQYRQPVGPHLLFSKSLHFVSSRNPPAFLFFFFLFPSWSVSICSSVMSSLLQRSAAHLGWHHSHHAVAVPRWAKGWVWFPAVQELNVSFQQLLIRLFMYQTWPCNWQKEFYFCCFLRNKMFFIEIMFLFWAMSLW